MKDCAQYDPETTYKYYPGPFKINTVKSVYWKFQYAGCLKALCCGTFYLASPPEFSEQRRDPEEKLPGNLKQEEYCLHLRFYS
jgi:hypothetical protein